MNPQLFESVQDFILKFVKHSPIDEDLSHALNTVKWLRRLNPEADEALQIAALGHDVDRAAGARRIHKADYPNFNEFKEAHAANSARVLSEILEHCGVNNKTIRDVTDLVAGHETGGNERADLLKWADSLSFFENNLHWYGKRHSYEEVRERIRWGLLRLPAHLRRLVVKMEFEDVDLGSLVRTELATMNS